MAEQPFPGAVRPVSYPVMRSIIDGAWRARLLEMPEGAAPSFDVAKSRTALVIIDMLYGCAHPDHEIGLYWKKAAPEMGDRYFARVWNVVVPNQQRLLAFFRAAGAPVIHLTVGSESRDGHDLNRLFLHRDEVVRAATGARHSTWRGAPSRQILSELAPLEDELVLNKLSKGAFNSTAIDQILRNMGVDGLVLGGVATNACVDTTARDAADRGYKCVLVEDACASPSPDLHDATMLNFQHLFGQVRTTDECLSRLAAWTHGAEARFATGDVRDVSAPPVPHAAIAAR